MATASTYVIIETHFLCYRLFIATAVWIKIMSAPGEIIPQLQQSFANLCETFALLQPEEIENGRMENGWAPKAVMAHVAFWDRAQTERMRQMVQSETVAPSLRPAVANNDQRAGEDANRPWAEILAEAEAARQQMIDFVGSLSQTQFEKEYAPGERSPSPAALFSHMVRHTNEHQHELSEYCGSMARWSKPALRRFVVEQYANLMDSIGGLDEATILATKVCGIWSMRDVLTHVLAWNEFEYSALKGWPQPSPESLKEWRFAPGDTIDTLNARLLAARSDLDMIAIVDWLATYHRKVLAQFDKASDEQLSTRADVGWSKPISMSHLIYDMSLHGLKHAEDIWQWKADQVNL